jgi:hypothetical protein
MPNDSKTTYPRIFIPTKNRPETISTHRYFQGYDYWVLVHNQQQYDMYTASAELTKLNPDRILITNVKTDQFGLTRQREWVTQQTDRVTRDEWFIFADDNIKDIQAVDPYYYNATSLPVQSEPFKDAYEQHCSPERFITEIFSECTGFAESLGAHHVGFAVVDNFYFRGNHWKKVAYIIGKLMIWKNSEKLQFDHTITMEDFELTAQSILKFGCAPVNNFVYPVAGHYEKGGMGTKKERTSDRLHDVELLQKKYPGLFTVKTRSDGNPDLSLKFYTQKAAEEWRKSFNAIRSPKDIWR